MAGSPLLQRLKARKLVQWALAYLAGAWVLVEASNLVVEQFGWPRVLGQAVTILAFFGFFLVLVLAWYHGEKGRQKISGPELIMIALLLLITGAVLTLLRDDTGAARAPPAGGDDGRPAIAVLPCENFSPDPDDAYLAAGIHEEILLKLQKVAGLRSIGRATVEWYRDNPRPMRDMAVELGVGFVGECSIRMDVDQDQIRLTFQLMDGETGTQIWSENYDNRLTAGNLFGIQSDIAQRVAQAIGAVLTPEEQERIGSRPTESLPAYNAYSIGRVWLERRGGQGSEALMRAIEYFEDALAEDSLFAPAHAGLAAAYLLSPSYGEFVPNAEAHARARDALSVALSIDENLAEAHAAQGFMRMQFEWDLPAAETELLRAVELNPGYARAYHWYGFYLIMAGRPEEAIGAMRTALDLDPLSPIINEDFGDATYYARQYERAVDQYHRTLSLFPGRESTHTMLGLAYLQLGRYAEAREELLVGMGGLDSPPVQWGSGAISRVFIELGETEAASALLERSGRWRLQQRLTALAGARDVDRSFAVIDTALASRAPWLWRVMADPLYDFLRADPRYAELLERTGLGR